MDVEKSCCSVSLTTLDGSVHNLFFYLVSCMCPVHINTPTTKTSVVFGDWCVCDKTVSD